MTVEWGDLAEVARVRLRRNETLIFRLAPGVMWTQQTMAALHAWARQVGLKPEQLIVVNGVDELAVVEVEK
jgi:hypothetical protein